MTKVKEQNFSKGRNGEEIAARYLTELGYQIWERNHRNNLGEVDIIASDKDILIFVEVKLKIGDRFGSPEEMITDYKLSRIRRIALAFLTINPTMREKFKKYRIDGVCIVLGFDSQPLRISHYKNIY
jgi:putative endonuclease